MEKQNNLFGFNDVEDTSSNFKPTIEPGIHEVTVLGWEDGEPIQVDSSPFRKLKFSNLEGTREVYVRLFSNPEVKEGKKTSALQVSLQTLKHIATACLNETEKANITASSLDTLMVKMLDAITGKKLRMKFVGREFMRDDGMTGVRTEIGIPNFAESIEVPASETSLRFNKQSSWDYRAIPKLEETNESENKTPFDD